ncbi:MAG: BatA domain-containing protein [Flavobacteriales bacterium]|nr:BatA domain-containing protein [Flavobacteriales bacterium]
MSFLEPGSLWALFALIIPVAIHLFQLRRFKRIEFPNTELLQEITSRTRSMRRVRHWAVLAARLGAISALVLAFAQPYIKEDDSRALVGRKAVSIFIDDSFSMDAQNEDGRMLDQARKAAQEIIMAHDQTDRFQVLTGRFEGRQQLLMGRDEALDAAVNIEASSFRRPLAQVIARQREALSRSDLPNKRAILLSDLQRGITDPAQWTDDPEIPTVIVPISSSAANDVSVDSVWFDTPFRRMGTTETLHVRLTNHGDDARSNIPVELRVNDVPRALATVSVGPGAQLDTTLRFSHERGGPHHASIAITDPPIVFDDRIHFAYTVADRISVLLLSAGDRSSDAAIEAVLSSDSAFVLRKSDLLAFDPSELDKADLVVLNGAPIIQSGVAQELKRFVERSGTLALFPGVEMDLASYNVLLSSFNDGTMGAMDTNRVQVARIDLEHPFYRDVFTEIPRNVDLPYAKHRYRRVPGPGTEILLRLQDRSAYLTRRSFGKGQLFVGQSPLTEAGGNFIRHALFVTTILRMAENSRPSGPLFHVIGGMNSIPLSVGLVQEAQYQLRGPDGVVLLPELRRSAQGPQITLHDEDLAPGPYALTIDNDTVEMLALNLSREESEQAVFPAEELTAAMTNAGLGSFSILQQGPGAVSVSLTELDTGRKLWKWMVALALLFLALEVFLIRSRP